MNFIKNARLPQQTGVETMEADKMEAFLDDEEGIIELEDEDGNVTQFEFIDRAELNGIVYYALIPTDFDDEDEAEFVVLKEIMSDGEAMLSTVDDDDEYNAAGEMFLKRFSETADYLSEENDDE